MLKRLSPHFASKEALAHAGFVTSLIEPPTDPTAVYGLSHVFFLTLRVLANYPLTSFARVVLVRLWITLGPSALRSFAVRGPREMIIGRFTVPNIDMVALCSNLIL